MQAFAKGLRSTTGKVATRVATMGTGSAFFMAYQQELLELPDIPRKPLNEQMNRLMGSFPPVANARENWLKKTLLEQEGVSFENNTDGLVLFRGEGGVEGTFDQSARAEAIMAEGMHPITFPYRPLPFSTESFMYGFINMKPTIGNPTLNDQFNGAAPALWTGGGVCTSSNAQHVEKVYSANDRSVLTVSVPKAYACVADHSPQSMNREYEYLVPRIDKEDVMFTIEMEKGNIVKVNINDDFFKKDRPIAGGKQLNHVLAKLNQQDPEQQRLFSLLKKHSDPQIDHSREYLQREASDSYSNYLRTAKRLKHVYDTHHKLQKVPLEEYLSSKLSHFTVVEKARGEESPEKMKALHEGLKEMGLSDEFVHNKLENVSEGTSVFKNRYQNDKPSDDLGPDLTVHV